MLLGGHRGLIVCLNSNTTLVKVKLTQIKENGEVKHNSNTTLVKVKFSSATELFSVVCIQIQHLLKLN